MTPLGLLISRRDAGEELEPEELDRLHLNLVFHILDYGMPTTLDESDEDFRRRLAFGGWGQR